MTDALKDVLVITSETLGQGNDELGRKLMGNYLITLAGTSKQPKSIFLLNAAVKFAAEGSNVIDELNELQSRGSRIFSCITCLEFFGLQDKLKCGETGTMRILVDAMESADKLTIL